MYCVKLNFFINHNYQRPELFVTKKQLENLIALRNNDETKDKLILIKGSGFWFAPKDILCIDELDSDSAWWQDNAPDYYFQNLKLEGSAEE